MDDKIKQKIFRMPASKIIIMSACAILFLVKFDQIISLILRLIRVSMPLIIGALMAFVLNIVVTLIEGHFTKIKRGLAIFMALAIVLAFIALIASIILPEIVKAIAYVIEELPKAFQELQRFAAEHRDRAPELADWIINMKIDWQKGFANLMDVLNNGASDQEAVRNAGAAAGTIVDNTVSVLGTVFNRMIDMLFSLIFAIYILARREQISRQMVSLVRFFIPEKGSSMIINTCKILHDNYRCFIIGQLTEACLLGTLCGTGMAIIGIPYALMIGALVGVTALIPIVGAWIGAVLGAFMVFTISPVGAAVFLVYIIILQQIEGNLIYPRVVGTSIGLPGIWVFASVTLGGGIAGIPGMLFMVPFSASVYQVLGAFVRNGSKSTDGFARALEEESSAELPLNPLIQLVRKLFTRIFSIGKRRKK